MANERLNAKCPQGMVILTSQEVRNLVAVDDQDPDGYEQARRYCASLTEIYCAINCMNGCQARVLGKKPAQEGVMVMNSAISRMVKEDEGKIFPQE